MKKTIMTLTAVSVFALLSITGYAADKPPAGLKLENLMTSEMAGIDNRELIVSRVSIPPHTTMPVHWHPGEEFAYILEGSVTLWQQGKQDITGHQGDVMKVPFKQVHTAKTGDQPAVILVMRIHEPGEPQRTLVK